jgi:nicotinate dehydrogenase subunit B
MHLSDPRAIAVLCAAAVKPSWAADAKGDGRHGRGVAFSRYKNINTYAAVIIDIDVDPRTGRIAVPSAVVAVDVGRVINPDGLANQIEGGLVQAVSFCLKERLRFDRDRIPSRDWISYPIIRFSDVPRVEVVLIDRPDEPSVGGGEGSLAPTVAAIANAFAMRPAGEFATCP